MAVAFEGGTAADHEAIAQLHARDEQASGAQDYETLFELMSADPVIMAPRASPVRGRAMLGPVYRSRRGQPLAVEIIGYAFDWAEVCILGDHAFEWGQITGAVRPVEAGSDAEPTPMRYNVMRILRREPDIGWRVHRSIWNDAPVED